MDDIQLCKEISRLKKELQKLIALPGKALQNFKELHPASALNRKIAMKSKKLFTMSPLGMLPEMLRLQAVHEQQELGSFGLT